MAQCVEFRDNFTDTQEELDYWKQQAHHYKETYLEIQEELNEFKESSKELEKELEDMLEMNENELKVARQSNAKLNAEFEALKDKLNAHQEESRVQLAELETKLNAASAWKSENTNYIRGLEQANDDFERTNRTQIETIEALEERLNDAIETNAYLEDELDEKQEVAATVQQRLRDEIRDLKQEIAPLQKKKATEEQSIVEVDSGEKTPSKSPELPEPQLHSSRRFLQSCKLIFFRLRQRLQKSTKVAMKL